MLCRLMWKFSLWIVCMVLLRVVCRVVLLLLKIIVCNRFWCWWRKLSRCG